MEVPQQKAAHKQEHAMIIAMTSILQDGRCDIEKPYKLASDILRKLHEAGYMIVPCKQFEINKK